jgi:hypothetical protein
MEGKQMDENETKHYIKEVLIEEYFTRENGEVYWNWRFQNGKWNKELTAFKEVPYYKVNFNHKYTYLWK